MPYNVAPAGFAKPKPSDVKTWSSWMGPQAQGKPEVNGVFKGGGPKGVAYAGVLRELEGKVAFRAISGASAGAIIAALVAAGYSAATLEDRISALDFGELLDERDWSTDDTVKRTYWDYKSRETPDLVTSIIMNNTELSKMMKVDDLVAREWSKKSWGRYFWDYGVWLLGATDDLVHDTTLWPVSVTARLSTGVVRNAVAAFSTYWYGTNPLATVPAINEYAPSILMYFLKRKLEGTELPAAITDKLQTEDSIRRILLAIYYMGGAFKGDRALVLVEKWLQEALYGQYDSGRTVAFQDMPIPLHIVATDVTNGRLLNFPDDLAGAPYNYTHPERFSVARAVRASMSIPLCFEPVELVYETGTAKGRRAMLVDGGVLSNYPVHAFVDDRTHPTVGFWVGDDLNGMTPVDETTIAGYSGGMFAALQEAHDRTLMKLMGKNLISAQIGLQIPLTEKERAARTKRAGELETKVAQAAKDGRAVAQWDLSTELNQVKAELEGGRLCGTLDFALEPAQKLRLIENGRTAGKAALQELMAGTGVTT